MSGRQPSPATAQNPTGAQDPSGPGGNALNNRPNANNTQDPPIDPILTVTDTVFGSVVRLLKCKERWLADASLTDVQDYYLIAGAHPVWKILASMQMDMPGQVTEQNIRDLEVHLIGRMAISRNVSRNVILNELHATKQANGVLDLERRGPGP